MKVDETIKELKVKYPGKNIIIKKDKSDNVYEIVCELGMTEDNSHTEAIMICDHFNPHYHKQTKEIFNIIKGNLKIVIENSNYYLKTGESKIVEFGQIHSGEGNDTWVKVESYPFYDKDDTFSLKHN